MFRAALLSQRWWLFYQKVYGTPAAYDLVLERTSPSKHRIPASHALPAVLQQDTSFERLFGCELLPNKSALLTVGAFSWPDKSRFFAFTQECFARMRTAGVQRLVIDVRTKGDGDDDMWKEGILRYIADRPYKTGSWATKRVLGAYRDDDEVTGQIITATLSSSTQPVPDDPLRFEGQVYVPIGPQTYSSAVLFRNVVQDYKNGMVAGVWGAVVATGSANRRGPIPTARRERRSA